MLRSRVAAHARRGRSYEWSPGLDFTFMTELQINSSDLGRRLQALRKLTGKTQMEVAASLGISRPSLAAIEAGQRRLDSRLLIELARAYGARVSELVREPSPRVSLRAQFRLPAD